MDTITVATQQLEAQAIQNTIDNYDQRAFKPKERVIEIQSKEVQFETIIDTQINIHKHSSFSLRWKILTCALTIFFTLTSCTLIGIAISLVTDIQDIETIRIQDSLYWYTTGIQVLLIISIVSSLIKVVYLIKEFDLLIKYSIKTSSAIIPILCTVTIVAWAFSRAISQNSNQICAENIIQLYDQFYQNITAQLSESCCPIYPYYIPQWSSFFNCNTNGTYTNCLQTLPGIITGQDNQKIQDISQTESQFQCIGICSRSPVQLNHNYSMSYLIRNSLIVQMHKGMDQYYTYPPCIQAAFDYFRNGIQDIWKYSLASLLIELLNLIIFVLFYVKISKLNK